MLIWYSRYIYYYQIYICWIESWIEQHLFGTEIFCNIINVFTVTFDQFNESLLNKNIFSFKNKKNLTPKLLNSCVYHITFHGKKLCSHIYRFHGSRSHLTPDNCYPISTARMAGSSDTSVGTADFRQFVEFSPPLYQWTAQNVAFGRAKCTKCTHPLNDWPFIMPTCQSLKEQWRTFGTVVSAKNLLNHHTNTVNQST